jgi:periplasmic divalent cation tolerance protein
MHDVVLVLTTFPIDPDEANAFARTLVEERLAACVNVHSAVTSIYRWEGAIEEAVERQLTIKTTTARLEALNARIKELHPYDVPEILVVPIAGGGEEYLRWVMDSV